jgi:hypothetical protein
MYAFIETKSLTMSISTHIIVSIIKNIIDDVFLFYSNTCTKVYKGLVFKIRKNTIVKLKPCEAISNKRSWRDDAKIEKSSKKN